MAVESRHRPPSPNGLDEASAHCAPGAGIQPRELSQAGEIVRDFPDCCEALSVGSRTVASLQLHEAVKARRWAPFRRPEFAWRGRKNQGKTIQVPEDLTLRRCVDGSELRERTQEGLPAALSGYGSWGRSFVLSRASFGPRNPGSTQGGRTRFDGANMVDEIAIRWEVMELVGSRDAIHE